MKKYQKPTIDVLELRINENLAAGAVQWIDAPAGTGLETGGQKIALTTYDAYQGTALSNN